jgi:hypothetical protein
MKTLCISALCLFLLSACGDGKRDMDDDTLSNQHDETTNELGGTDKTAVDTMAHDTIVVQSDSAGY